ncbi:hypothetical protein DFH29DRAFT_131408 [Suillus ampliporus]|nr:hypothetical protein DFH29DRAFT_131408 [Suillus ampliporus]
MLATSTAVPSSIRCHSLTTRRSLLPFSMDPEHIFHYNSRRKVAIQFFSGAGVNHTTTIIIVVLCAVVGMLILFGLFRFLRHRFARRSVPLPPVQPIAHYRKQRLTEFAERPDMSTTYSQSSRLSPSFGLSPAASDSSLLPPKSDQTFPSRQSSLYLAEKGDDHGVPLPPAQGEEVLRTPNPVFNHARRFSNSSLGSAPSTPPSAYVASRSPSQATLPRSYPRYTGPASAVSSASIRSTRSSGRSTIVGVPHGPHSQVKVILPVPLSPSLHPYLSGPEIGRLGVDAQTPMRTTMVDMWTPPLHRSVSSDHIRKLQAFLFSVDLRAHCDCGDKDQICPHFLLRTGMELYPPWLDRGPPPIHRYRHIIPLRLIPLLLFQFLPSTVRTGHLMARLTLRNISKTIL